MAKYTAEITNKDLIDGELIIQIRYTGDDGSIIQDSARTRSTQDDNWATNLIARKIEDLEKLPSFVDTISLGEVNLIKDPIVIEVTKTPKEEFQEDYQKFSKLSMLVRQGLINSGHTEFSELLQKLKNNFNLEYLDII